MANYSHGNTGYQGNRGNNGYGNVPEKVESYKPLSELTYVDDAEKIMSNRKGAITTNQIRIILDLINEVYIPVKKSTEAADTELNEKTRSKLQYIKMKIAYQAGRDYKVKDFVGYTNIMKHINNAKTKGDVILLAHYMEALVAYHKYYGLG